MSASGRRGRRDERQVSSRNAAPRGVRGRQAKEGRHGVGGTKNRTSTKTMREWEGGLEPSLRRGEHADFHRISGLLPQPSGAWGWADWAGGAARPQAAGYAAWGQLGCGAEAGVQGTGRGWPLTLDLQDLVAEIGLEVEGAVGREHEP